MNSIRILFFILITSPLYSQVEISNKNFNYFDLMQIEKNHYHSQILLSATLDEIGYNGEWYKIKKNYFSLNFIGTYKRLLPNIGQFWAPLTLQNISILPQNGINLAVKGKWYFNHRKFAFAGIKISTGYYWLNNRDVPSHIDQIGPPVSIQHIFWAKNQRQGLDVFVGRKLVNKLISEIMVEAGFRKDRYKYQYQCVSNCNSSGNDPVNSRKGFANFYHFQLFLAFDLFSE